MCDMGYGLTVEDVKSLAYQIAENSGWPHPFHDGKAGRDWYEGFLRRLPQITLWREEALSYMRAKNANEKVIEDFFAKLASVLVRLNILSKPMLVYNADETGFSKVHKSQSRVLARRGQKAVWGITSGENTYSFSLRICIWPCHSTTNNIPSSSHAWIIKNGCSSWSNVCNITKGLDKSRYICKMVRSFCVICS